MATKSTGKTPGSTTRPRTTRKNTAVDGGAAAMAPDKPSPAKAAKRKAATTPEFAAVVTTAESMPAISYADAVRLRAYQYFEERGCQHGHDVEDWLRAEYDINTRTR